METIKVLQLGNEDWNRIYEIPENIELTYCEKFAGTGEKKQLYDLVFIDRQITDMEAELLYQVTRAYTLYVTTRVRIKEKLEWLCLCKKAEWISEDQIQKFITNEAKYFFSTPYGEKFSQTDLTVSRNFNGSVQWDGNYCLSLEGNFGEEYTQIVFWRRNIPVFQGQKLDLWLEYQKSTEVSIEMTVIQFVNGSISEVQNYWKFNEKEIEHIIEIESEKEGVIFVSLRAKGNGTIKIIALHDRKSRGSHGYFIPGGERYVTSDREEIFAYFDPGDLKPPLNVYFSGYKTLEGFEGYYMLRKLGSPFLLIAESRLEGGCFYMGTEEYEQLLVKVIQKYMKELNFTSEEVVLSGLSMGTYGAVYYGCDIRPHAILLGKPLANIGNVAANEKRIRPGGFPTSLDVLKYLCGDTNEEAIQTLNRRFWNKFDDTDWIQTKFILSYMIEDDYDPETYQNLISHLAGGDIQIYGKGMHGRHNDNSVGIVTWFVSQYKKILSEDFKREVEEK